MDNIFDYSKIDHLVECLSYYADYLLIEDSLFESWEAGWKTSNMIQKETMTKSIEKYNINLMVDEIMNSSIDINEVHTLIDKKIECLLNNNDMDRVCSNNLEELEKIRGISLSNVDIKMVEEFIGTIKSISNLLYMKGLLNNYKGINYKARLYDSKNLRAVRIVSIAYHLLINAKPNSEMFNVLDSAINGLLYRFKRFDHDTSHSIHDSFTIDDISKEELGLYTPDDVVKLFVELTKILETESDYIIDYVIEELTSYSDLIYKIKNKSSLQESFTGDDTNEEESFNLIESRFDDIAHELFGENSNDELDIDKFIEFCSIARKIAEKEVLNEASSRIITKGTEKVTRSIGSASAKSRGMTKSDSKIDQVKRGAKIIDDRASDAINRKIDQVINITKDAKREKLITGRNTVKLGKAIKTVIGILGATGVAKIAFGPVVGAGVSAITALGAYALSKRTEEREKKRILLDMETELKIVKEKIEDAKGDNAREQKYQLMRIQASLEKEITRIRHGLRYY